MREITSRREGLFGAAQYYFVDILTNQPNTTTKLLGCGNQIFGPHKKFGCHKQKTTKKLKIVISI